jgi:hypothetical protein
MRAPVQTPPGPILSNIFFSLPVVLGKVAYMHIKLFFLNRLKAGQNYILLHLHVIV